MKMHDSTLAAEFINELAQIHSSDRTPRKKALAYKLLLTKLLKLLTKDVEQLFSNQFSKGLFILDKSGASRAYKSEFRSILNYLNLISRNAKEEVSQEDLDKINSFINDFIKTLIDRIDPKLEPLQNNQEVTQDSIKPESLLIVKAVFVGLLKSEDDYTLLKFESEDYGLIAVRFIKPWLDFYKLVWRNAGVNLFGLELITDEAINTRISRDSANPINDFYTLTKHSLVVIEPDYLLNVTELAECFDNKSFNPYIYFLKSFQSTSSNFSLVTGTIVNHCFDELLSNPEADFDSVFNQALRIKPMQILCLLKEDPDSVKYLRSAIANHFENIKINLKKLELDLFMVEPTFISPDYGIHGRLDVLIESLEDPLSKEVLELKSGRPPQNLVSYRTKENVLISTKLWVNHFAQVTLYNLLLDAAFANRNGSSGIFYSIDYDTPLRNAPNDFSMKVEVLLLRNIITALERNIANRNFSIFNSLANNNAANYPAFLRQDLQKFAEIYNSCSDIEKNWFHEYYAFVLREMFFEKAGDFDERARGFASLWKLTLEEKAENFSVISNLTYKADESDISRFYLTFSLPEDDAFFTSFRKGDLVIVYNSQSGISPYRQQITKATIREINSQSIVVSLRNKSISEDFQRYKSGWVLESDYLDSNKKLLNSLFQFLSAGDKKSLILGLTEPEHKTIIDIENNAEGVERLLHDLHESQKSIFYQAINTCDYYLIQGPPGTGKTSKLLRAITEYYFKFTDENIIITAYTNRAVDEIANHFDEKLPDIDYLRFGSKESYSYEISNYKNEDDMTEQYTSRNLNVLAEYLPFKELSSKIEQTRIFITTISSALYYPEIFETKSFDIAIIDEASQILEPQLVGLLTKVRKFIMIGDEKQLPAVVISNDASVKCTNPLLNRIGISDFASSMFERLVLNARSKGWNHSFGLLTHQGRMDIDIQGLINKLFYNEKLKSLKIEGEMKFIQSPDYLTELQVKLINLVNKSNLIFIDSPIEKVSKVNTEEASRVCRIIGSIIKSFNIDADKSNPLSIGCIAPFRLQCYEIRKQLDKMNIRDVTVDTVERFQGSERDIMIISFAINYEYNLGAISSLVEIEGRLIDRKLNVALSRAKHKLILHGNSEILSRNSIYREMIDYIKAKGIYLSNKDFINLMDE